MLSSALLAHLVLATVANATPQAPSEAEVHRNWGADRGWHWELHAELAPGALLGGGASPQAAVSESVRASVRYARGYFGPRSIGLRVDATPYMVEAMGHLLLGNEFGLGISAHAIQSEGEDFVAFGVQPTLSLTRESRVGAEWLRSPSLIGLYLPELGFVVGRDGGTRLRAGFAVPLTLRLRRNLGLSIALAAAVWVHPERGKSNLHLAFSVGLITLADFED